MEVFHKNKNISACGAHPSAPPQKETYMKRICAFLTLLIFLVSGLSAFAADLPLAMDFSGSEDNRAPEGFTAWATGAGLITPRPAITAPGGVLGTDSTDISSVITSGAGVRATFTPSVRRDLDVSAAGGVTVTVKMAALDKNSDKYFYLRFEDNKTPAPADKAFMMGADGYMYAFGTKVAERYDTNRWYNVSISLFDDKTFSLYIDGILTLEKEDFIPDASNIGGSFTKLHSFFYGLGNKKADSDESAVAVNSVSFIRGGLPLSSQTGISSNVVTVDDVAMTVSGLPEGMTKDAFLQALTAPGGADVQLVDQAGNPVSEGTVKTGHIVLVTSGDGSNKARYSVVNLALTLSANVGERVNPGTTVRLIVTADGELSESVKLYVNGQLAQTLAQPPYEYSFIPANGQCSVSAEVVVEGTKIYSNTISFLVQANVKPTVSFEDISNGQTFEYGSPVKFNVLAADADGYIDMVVLYLDGIKVAEKGEAPYSFELSNVTMGRHFMYAEAFDNEGERQQTSEIEFLVSSFTETVHSFVDYDNNTASVWGVSNATGGTHGRENTGGEHKNAYFIARTPTSTNPAPYFVTYSNLNTLIYGDSAIELDYMTDNANASVEMFVLRGDGSPVTWTTSDCLVKDGAFIGNAGTVDIEAGRWYHLRYEFNLVRKTASFWVDDTLVTNKNGNLSTDGTLNSIRFTVKSEEGETEEIKNYLDNIKITTLTAAPYISGATFANADGTNAGSRESVSPYVKTIKLNFSSDVAGATVNDKNVLLYDDNNNQVPLSVEYNQQLRTATLTLDSNLQSMAWYKVVVTDNVLNSLGQKLTSELVSSFKTAPFEYDATAWGVYRNGNILSSTANVRAGDNIKVACEMVNGTDIGHDAVMLVGLYKNGIMTGYKTMNAAIQANTEKTFELELAAEEGGITEIRAFVWKGLNERRPVVKQFVFK